MIAYLKLSRIISYVFVYISVTHTYHGYRKKKLIIYVYTIQWLHQRIGKIHGIVLRCFAFTH